MAVPKKKTSSSKGTLRRNHNNKKRHKPANVERNEQGELVLRHHISAGGFYKGKRVMPLPKEDADVE